MLQEAPDPQQAGGGRGMIDISTHRLGTEPTLHKREVPAPKTRGKSSLLCFIRTYDLFRSSEVTGTSANLTESLGTHTVPFVLSTLVMIFAKMFVSLGTIRSF